MNKIARLEFRVRGRQMSCPFHIFSFDGPDFRHCRVHEIEGDVQGAPFASSDVCVE